MKYAPGHNFCRLIQLVTQRPKANTATFFFHSRPLKSTYTPFSFFIKYEKDPTPYLDVLIIDDLSLPSLNLM